MGEKNIRSIFMVVVLSNSIYWVIYFLFGDFVGHKATLAVLRSWSRGLLYIFSLDAVIFLT